MKDTPRYDHDFTSEDLVRWREGLGLSQRDAAKAIGVARQSYSNYEDGSSPIPKYVALSCPTLSIMLKPRARRE